MVANKVISSQSSIEALRALVAPDLTLVNNKIITLSKRNQVDLITHMAEHLIAAGGKRLRPILTLICAKLCGYQGSKHIDLAACVELIHTATLLHDDVVDESKLRRGNATANDIWGNKSSVLVGDFLLSQAFELMVEVGSLEVLKLLSHTSAVLAEGEVMQLVATNNLATTEDDYIQIISSKTAKLFASACEVAAIIADVPEHQRQALQAYGLNLGIAFQIIDDVLDYSAKQEALGKTIGDDFRESKVTLPVIFAYKAANEEEKQFWQRVIEDETIETQDFTTATDLINKYNSLGKAIDLAKEYAKKSRESLEQFKDSAQKQILFDLSLESVDREA